MRLRPQLVLSVYIIALTIGVASNAVSGERAALRKGLGPQQANAAAGYPRAATDPWPLPGPQPYWGQALGGTYYNWGYFGAHQQHAQFIDHTGYYGQYYQYGYTKGY